MPDLYSISDEAYEGLSRLAAEQNFIGYGAQRRTGMSSFLERLSYREFYDTRDEEIQGFDEQLIAAGYVPIWRIAENERVQRALDLSNEALCRYAEIGFKFKITMGRRYKHGPLYKSLLSITAAVLEAIGLGWLTATDLPVDLTEQSRTRSGDKIKLMEVPSGRQD